MITVSAVWCLVGAFSGITLLEGVNLMVRGVKKKLYAKQIGRNRDLTFDTWMNIDINGKSWGWKR